MQLREPHRTTGAIATSAPWLYTRSPPIRGELRVFILIHQAAVVECPRSLSPLAELHTTREKSPPRMNGQWDEPDGFHSIPHTILDRKCVRSHGHGTSRSLSQNAQCRLWFHKRPAWLHDAIMQRTCTGWIYPNNTCVCRHVSVIDARRVIGGAGSRAIYYYCFSGGSAILTTGHIGAVAMIVIKHWRRACRHYTQQWGLWALIVSGAALQQLTVRKSQNIQITGTLLLWWMNFIYLILQMHWQTEHSCGKLVQCVRIL